MTTGYRKPLGNKSIENDASRLRALIGGSGANERHEFIYEQAGSFTTSTGGLRAYNRFGNTFYINEVHCSVSASVAGTAVVVDVHKNGTTIFSTQGNRPQIAVGDYTGSSSAIDTTSLAHGDYVTVDVDQGSGTNLAVVISISR